MKNQILAIAAIAVILSGPAQAGPDRLSLLVGSRHLGADRHFEESNPGLFLTWEDRHGVDLTVGAFRNSFGGTSVAATAAMPVFEHGGAQVSLFGGLAVYPGDGDQFEFHAGDIVPIGGLQARVGNMFLQALPAGGMTVIAAGVTMPLHRGR